MSVKVVATSKAMSDLEVIAGHVRKFNDAATAGKVVNALLDESERLGQDHFHRLGEELDGYDGPQEREDRHWVCLAGRYDLHYECCASVRGRTNDYRYPSHLGPSTGSLNPSPRSDTASDVSLQTQPRGGTF